MEPLRLRRAPLLAAALCFAAGECLTQLPPHGTRPTIVLLCAACTLAALTLLTLRQSLRLTMLGVLALWIAAGLWSAQIEPAPAPQTALLAYADGLSRTVQGRVVRVRILPARGGDTDADFDPDQWEEPSGTAGGGTGEPGAANAGTGDAGVSLDLAVTAIEDVKPDTARMAPIAGGVRVSLYPARAGLSLQRSQPQLLSQLRCGELVELPLRLRAPERYRDPGAWQYADHLLDQGIAATADTSIDKLHSSANGAPTPLAASLHCRLFAAQSWAAARLLAYTRSVPNRRLPRLMRLTPDDAGMLNAMLFGDRSRLSHALRLGFERTGSFHLFVVSGMHVALLAGMLFWLARRLRLGELAATCMTLALVTAYALLTGFGIPVQRALLMTAVFLLARLLTRQRNTLNALGAAALAVLVASPHALFEASFQMTFLAIVAIAGIAIPLGERSFLPYAHAARGLRDRWRDTALPPRLAAFRTTLRMWGEALVEVLGPRARALPVALVRVAFFALELALIGIVAEAVMVLPMALTFHRATVFALPANMVSIPLVAVLAPLGLVTFLASLVSPYLAALPASALALLLHAVTGAIQRLGRAQAADLRIPGPTLAHALLAVTCFAFCCWAVRRSRVFALLGIAALPLAAAIVLWPSAPVVRPGQLEVTAIDVGQGDSLLVVGPGGRTMLVDAGGPTGAAANAENAAGLGTNDEAFDVGEEVVSPYLWSRQLRRLDVVALTHAHSDHMGGMPAVLRNLRPRELWVAVDPNSAPYRALLAEAAALGIRVRHLRAGDRVSWDATEIAVLAPTPAYANPGPPVNNDSLVMRMSFGRASVLLEGDAEAPSEHRMAVAALLDPAAALGPDTLLKVGHHGSRTSTTPEFLALVAPQDAVISVGANNTFGHPRPEIVERLADAHAHVFRTDEFGLTTFLLSYDGKISAQTGASNPAEAPMEAEPTNTETAVTISAEEKLQEQKLIRRLQMMMNLVMQTIAQDSSLSIDEAAQMIADSRKAALAMFPGKELAYDLIWRPRFQRLMRERFRIM